MCTAAPSSRTSTIRMPFRATWSQIGWMWPPCKPKIRSTPRFLRKRAIHAAQLFSLEPKSFVDALTTTLPVKEFSVCRLHLTDSGFQNAVLHLAGSCARHFLVGNDCNRTRPLVTGEPLTTPRHEFCFDGSNTLA